MLVVLIGKATRLAQFFTSDHKVYLATVRFGFATTTYDREGDPTSDDVPVHLDSLQPERWLAGDKHVNEDAFRRVFARDLLAVEDPPSYPGRFHRVGDRATWYASLTEQDAWAQFFRHHPRGGVDPFEVRRRIGAARVDRGGPALPALSGPDPELHEVPGPGEIPLRVGPRALVAAAAAADQRGSQQGREDATRPRSELPSSHGSSRVSCGVGGERPADGDLFRSSAARMGEIGGEPPQERLDPRAPRA